MKPKKPSSKTETSPILIKEWVHKRAQVKQRRHKLPQLIRKAAEVINREEQKMGRPPKLDLEKESKSIHITCGS